MTPSDFDTYSTADHPPCVVCDPSLLPEGWDPIDPKAAIVRPDGSLALLRGSVEVLLDGEMIRDVYTADPDLGVLTVYHRAPGRQPPTAAQERRGATNADKPPTMVRHFCQRGPVGRRGACANCGEAGAPGHHWMPAEEAYVCIRSADRTEEAPPPVEPHACKIMVTGKVDLLDKATGEPAVFYVPPETASV
jgi:hypothetical protein